MFNKIFNIRFNKVFLILFSFVVAILVGLGTFFSGLTSVAYAEIQEGIDTSYVMDDLEGLEIDGKEFDVADYPFDDTKKLEVLTFVEYGYSKEAKYQSIFGLYVYLYNPQGLSFQNSSSLNEITLSIDSSGTSALKSYRLKYVSRSLGADIKDLFLKFRVDFSTEELNDIRAKLSESTKRIYSIGEVELLESGKYQATSFPAGNVYTYAGFGKGLDETSQNASTLTCTKNGLEVISPKVGLTSYTLPGINGEGSYCHDMVFSAYFSVSNELIDKYGPLYSLSGEYLDAVLAPALVTGSSIVRNSIEPYLGIELTENRHPTDPEGRGFYIDGLSFDFSSLKVNGYLSASGFNYNGESFPDASTVDPNDFLSTVDSCDPLYLLFYAEGLTEDNVSNFSLSSSVIKEFMLSTKGKQNYSQELILDKYSKDIFSYVAEEKSEFRITSDKEYDLTNILIKQGFLQKWFGGYKVVSDESFAFGNVAAVYEVKKEDFMGKEITDICNDLLISESDYLNFKAAYDNAVAHEETLFLFRYRVAPYVSVNASCHLLNSLGTGTSIDQPIPSRNHYFFQTSVSLQFDVIDVSFKADDIETFIPVAVSPMDHMPDAKGPVDTVQGDLDKVFDWLKLVLVFVVLVFVVWILNKTGLLPYVIKGIGYILFSPYYLLKWIFSDGSNKKRYKKKRR